MFLREGGAGYLLGVDARIVAVACTCLLACGTEAPEPVEPIELEEVCGKKEPVRLLRYAPWRRVETAWHDGVFGDRRLVTVFHADTETAPYVLWSVGMCGEDPRQLLSGSFTLWTAPGQAWPFACKGHSGELYVIDPSGERAPRLVGRLSAGCGVTRSEFGLFGLRAHSADNLTGDLVSYPWPVDVWNDELEPVILDEEVKRRGLPGQIAWDALQGNGDELFFVRVSGELMRMNTADTTVEPVAHDVAVFNVGRERDDSELGYWHRYVVWQDIQVTNGDAEAPEGELLLLDRATSEVSSLGNGSLVAAHLGAANWTTSGLLQVPVRVDDELVLRLFQLPALSYVDVPATILPHYMLDDDRHMVVRFGEDGPLGTLDLQTGETVSFEKLFSNPSHGYWHEQRIVLLFPAAGSAPLAEGEVWAVRNGEPPELFAERATRSHRLMSDGRLLTGINLDRHGSGDLIVVDDFEERLIDQGVSMSFIAVTSDAGEHMVSYSIREGDRAGLWLARLPPF